MTHFRSKNDDVALSAMFRFAARMLFKVLCVCAADNNN